MFISGGSKSSVCKAVSTLQSWKAKLASGKISKLTLGKAKEKLNKVTV